MPMVFVFVPQEPFCWQNVSLYTLSCGSRFFIYSLLHLVWLMKLFHLSDAICWCCS